MIFLGRLGLYFGLTEACILTVLVKDKKNVKLCKCETLFMNKWH